MTQVSLFSERTTENKRIIEKAKKLFLEISALEFEEKIKVLNEIKVELRNISPFKSEPVDCVVWVKAVDVYANDYNPNSVAPPEMKLLERSIQEDGYTQPIVSWKHDGIFEVVDGFHRHRVGKESEIVKKRIKGYLPVVIINEERNERGDRIAATIRHNRARGKHKIESMSDIVVELKRRNWTDERISRELGMDQDEILRLCQITGLAELFSDQIFSKSWDVEGQVSESDFKELTDDVSTFEEEAKAARTVNTSDEKRVFHTYDKWECFKAGFYEGSKEGMTKQQCEEAYRDFLSDDKKFRKALSKVIKEWKNSCEHYLTNASMNRIAWLGQASACYALGIPSAFRGGFYLMTESQQKKANETALEYLNKWLKENGYQQATLEEAETERQSDIY